MVRDRKSTRLNSSHLVISYAVFCLKKKKRREVKARVNHVGGGGGPRGDRSVGDLCRRGGHPLVNHLCAGGGHQGESIFFFNDTATTEIYTLSLHDALPIWLRGASPVTTWSRPPVPFSPGSP